MKGKKIVKRTVAHLSSLSLGQAHLIQYKMAKHVHLHIAQATFSFDIHTKSVSKEAELDGIYVIRSSLGKQVRTANDIVLDYKSLKPSGACLSFICR